MPKEQNANRTGRLAARLKAFRAHSPTLLDDTHLARVWKVVLQDGSKAVLKLYHDATMGNETASVTFLSAAQGTSAVDIMDHGPDCILMRYLDGPRLGDLSRDGRDLEANEQLVVTAARLHAAVPSHLRAFPKLQTWFQDLFDLKVGWRCPRSLRTDMARAKALTQALLNSSTDVRPLHGDFHHDNVIVTNAGPKAFDAKGLLGETAFELANAFRNPTGADTQIHDPDRALKLARLAAEHLGVDPQRQLAWAAAKCALSIAWRAHKKLNEDDPDAETLSMLLSLKDRQCATS